MDYMNVLTLDWKGALLGLGMAVALIILGYGIFGWFFVLTLLYFLILSAIVTYVGREFKIGVHLYQKSRGVKNVLANGLPALAFAFLFFVSMLHGNDLLAKLGVVGFVSSVAAVMADKFGSELGVLDGIPISIVSFRQVKKGISGGVTLLGLAASLAGAMLISLAFIPLPLINNGFGMKPEIAAVIVIVAGFAGSIIDSVLGHYEEKGIGTKYTTNFICGISGGIIAALLYLLVV